MTGRFLRHPLPYLVLLIGLVYSHVESRGWLEPEITNDTQGYEHLLSATTMTEALSGLRTWGYPLVIRVFGLQRDGWAAVPRFHFILYSLAVLLFWFAVARFARSRWLAFAAATPLLLGSALGHVRLVVTDSIAESLGLATVSLLLLLIAGRWRVLIALFLGLTVFAAYWTRPIYQFLVVLVPLLGPLLALCHRPRQRLALGRWTAGLAALTFLPLIAFSLLRLTAVGHFGVSSFSGYHVGSIGAMMLDEELVAAMPGDLEPLAREIFEERQRRGLRPMRLTSPSHHYQARQFGLTMFDIVEPISTRLVMEDLGRTLAEDRSTDLGPMDIPGIMGPTALEMDERLVALGRAAIRERPLVYLKWILDAVRLSVAKTLSEPLIPVLCALLALSTPALMVRAARRPALLERPWADRALATLALVLVATVYFLGHSLIVALVHWPKDRYATAANLLLPAALAAGLFELWRWILPPRTVLPTSPGPGRTARLLATGLAMVLGLAMAEIVFRLTAFDFARQEQKIARIRISERWPTVATGEVFFRRPGPAVWKGTAPIDGSEVEIRYDADGFRNPPQLEDWGVVVVGDGFVEAGRLPQEKLFTSELARRLGLGVKNLGVNFTGTLTQIHYLETWGKSASTQHAVLVFNEGDDLDDLRREAGELYRFESSGRRGYRRIEPQSSLLRALLGRPTRSTRALLDAGAGATRRANADLMLPGVEQPVRVRISQRVPGPRSLPQERIEQLDEVLRRWVESARRLGLEPWVVYMPCKHRILDPYLRFDDDVEAALRDWNPTALPVLVERIARAHGAGFIDAGPRLARATARGGLVYHPIDIHLTETGSAQVGRLLAARLAEPPPTG